MAKNTNRVLQPIVMHNDVRPVFFLIVFMISKSFSGKTMSEPEIIPVTDLEDTQLCNKALTPLTARQAYPQVFKNLLRFNLKRF